VADETSMIDVPLMHKLIQALPERAHLLTVGDVDQLPSFGPGSALADIIRSEVMMIVTLTAQRASFFDADQPTRPRRRQSNLEPRQRVKDTGRRDNCPRRPAVPPQNAANMDYLSNCARRNRLCRLPGLISLIKLASSLQAGVPPRKEVTFFRKWK